MHVNAHPTARVLPALLAGPPADPPKPCWWDPHSLQAMLKARKVSKPLRHKVLEYLKHNHARHRILKDSAILEVRRAALIRAGAGVQGPDGRAG